MGERINLVNICMEEVNPCIEKWIQCIGRHTSFKRRDLTEAVCKCSPPVIDSYFAMSALIQIVLHICLEDIVELLHFTDIATDFDKYALIKGSPKTAF